MFRSVESDAGAELAYLLWFRVRCLQFYPCARMGIWWEARAGKQARLLFKAVAWDGRDGEEWVLEREVTRLMGMECDES